MCDIDSNLKRFYLHGVWVSEAFCKGCRRLRAIGLAGGKEQHKDLGDEAGTYFMKKRGAGRSMWMETLTAKKNAYDLALYFCLSSCIVF